MMGTLVWVELTGARPSDELQAIATQVLQRMQQIDRAMSFHRPDSELSRLNRAPTGRNVELSDDLTRVLSEALWLSEVTDGQFDVSVGARLVEQGRLPCHEEAAGSFDGSWRDIELSGRKIQLHRPLQLDLGGIAKGYAVDAGMALVPADVSACINAGGDLRMHPWQDRAVQLRLPDDNAPGGATIQMNMQAAALATSIGAPGPQLGAVLDPHSGQWCTCSDSISVFAATAMRADALTKWLCLAAASDRPLAVCAELLHRLQASA
ncbi:MAG: FAD:protein FMN transferase, partial [Xanthomonadales bacterium]|nr:FAD:protein FMN transferase [Xanthomonadales bacterium]